MNKEILLFAKWLAQKGVKDYSELSVFQHKWLVKKMLSAGGFHSNYGIKLNINKMLKTMEVADDGCK